MSSLPRLLLAFFFLLAAALPASASDLHGTLGYGVADSHDGESAHVIDLSLRWKANTRFSFIHQHEILAGHIESRPLPFLNRDVRYLGYGTRTYFRKHWFLGGGIVAVDNTTEALSSWYQFATSGGVQFGRASLTLRHLSNSGFRGRNRGETYLTLGYNW